MTLEELRTQIDTVDQQLTQLLEKRMALVLQIAEYKKTTQKTVRDLAREQIVLEEVAQRVKNPEYTATIVATYQDILKHSRAYQTNFLKK